ncbi:MAG: hypothetical protein ACRDT2_11375 [Natronosporangium sp.]
MYPDGDGAFGHYEEDDRCPACFVPPMATHLDSCAHTGIWEGDDDDQPDQPVGHWGG